MPAGLIVKCIFCFSIHQVEMEDETAGPSTEDLMNQQEQAQDEQEQEDQEEVRIVGWRNVEGGRGYLYRREKYFSTSGHVPLRCVCAYDPVFSNIACPFR